MILRYFHSIDLNKPLIIQSEKILHRQIVLFTRAETNRFKAKPLQSLLKFIQKKNLSFLTLPTNILNHHIHTHRGSYRESSTPYAICQRRRSRVYWGCAAWGDPACRSTCHRGCRWRCIVSRGRRTRSASDGWGSSATCSPGRTWRIGSAAQDSLGRRWYQPRLDYYGWLLRTYTDGGLSFSRLRLGLVPRAFLRTFIFLFFLSFSVSFMGFACARWFSLCFYRRLLRKWCNTYVWCFGNRESTYIAMVHWVSDVVACWCDDFCSYSVIQRYSTGSLVLCDKYRKVNRTDRWI